MKLKKLGMLGLLLVAGVVATLRSMELRNQMQVRQLLETRACPGCNLRHSDLQNIDLSGVDLQGADLQGANLRGAQLQETNLRGANLRQANLQNATLGCKAVNFNLKAGENNASIIINNQTDDPNAAQQTVFNLNIDADEQSAHIQFNLRDCNHLEGINLQGARMPDGEIHP